MDNGTDKTINVELKVSELFQLHLSVISRSAYATQKWASAMSDDEQRQMQSEISFLTELDTKLVNLLNSLSGEAKK